MSESPLNNISDTTEDNKPDAVVLSNGTVLLAATDEEGEEKENSSVTKEDEPKVDLTKFVDEVNGDQVVIPDSKETEQGNENGSEDEVDGVVGGETPAREGSPESADPTSSIPITEEATNDEQPTINIDSIDPETAPTHTIAEPTLAELHSSHPSPIVRAVTPSSRTSTPPLGSTSLAKKKFSSVNVNQKFLSKAGSPIPTTGPTKVSSINGRPSSSPVPIASTSSRLLTTKLTTVPSSKSNASSNPPGSTSASSSPWAKPVIPLPAEPIASSPAPPPPSTTLHQPAPTRARVLGTTTVPVMGAGLVSAVVPPKPAWKAVTGETRKPGLGISRDFPTAKEVAEGKRAAQIAAQAHAAHNQAILQELNTFTQLDPGAHRWDEEDEDDDVIDFGDGTGEHLHQIEPSAIEPPSTQPVSKSERFAEDFDRSWPRRAPVPQEEIQRRPDGDSGRVLFNASSNRLELPRQQSQTNIQPTRLMSRPTDPTSRHQPPHLTGGRNMDRPLPPHLQGEQSGSDRMLPPHMSHPLPDSRVQPLSSSAAPTRSAWSIPRENERPPPPHATERRELPSQSATFGQSRSPEKTLNHLPPRRSFSHAAGPTVGDVPPASAAAPSSGSPAVGVDAQSAEMHTAAEKARLRRLAEESEREAAAERARQKARVLEERFKPKSLIEEPKVETALPPASIPGKVMPQFTLAQRPKPPQTESSAPPHHILPSRPEAVGDRQTPVQVTRGTESSWRSRMHPGQESQGPAESLSSQPATILSQPNTQHRQNRPTAESFFDAQPGEPPKVSLSQTSPDAGVPKKDAIFDSTLARIQAAMAQMAVARATPSPPAIFAEEPLHQTRQSPEAITGQLGQSPAPAQPPAPKSATIAVQEYFDVTYPEPPRSPPPVWRTYTIKLPKSSSARQPISRHRQQVAEGPSAPSPNGWLMSFNPPLEGVNPISLSRSDLLLPQPVLRRYQRSEPIVSISPRQLEPFEKKVKRKPSVDVVRSTVEIPNTPAESLLPATTTFKSQSLRDQRNRADDWRQEESLTTVEKPIMPTADEPPKVEPPPRKTKSPVKNSAAAKAEREGRFVFDGVTIGAPTPDKERLALSDKPGVRFMVSSELEGDSLLDEVNKMSLETLGEEDKAQNVEAVAAKAAGPDAPKTPPVPRPASPNTSAWPSASLSYPASHSPARTSSQHDHLKSVWEVQQAAPKQNAESSVAAPMYPSLNAPSSTDPPAAQTLPGGIKMAFSNSQTFSSPGAGPSLSSSNSYGTLRPSPATHSQYNQFGSPQSIPSPDTQPHLNMMGLNAYSSSRTGTATGTNGFQQGVWSPTAFGTSMASPGYGYTAPPKSASDHKSQSQLQSQSPSGTISYNPKSPETMGYNGYPTNSYQQQQQQQYSTSQGYGRGINQSMYYGYGAPGQIQVVPQQQQNRPVGGPQSRFSQISTNGEYVNLQHQNQHQHHQQQQYSIDGQSGYYGGLTQSQSHQNQQQQQQNIYQNQSTQSAYPHQTLNHGAVGQNQIGRGIGGSRKMW
ncbi:uncharacterized protein IL334_005866 [Kwoniella shivajii]|uniref:Uncharacterized protein n=1 Tax=Kwoniella shivajii TaxID=564305 RepID=A0ABZ1D6E4_9TREE|nr:hypothetical protein IL334_005866 [Kwoniella shivajii]